MPIKEWFREKLAATTALPIATGFSFGDKDVDGEVNYGYDNLVKLGRDERIESMLLLISSMCFGGYQGIYVEPEDEFEEDKFDQGEKNCVNEAIKFARRINIRGLFYTYAYNMIQFGNYIERMVIDGSGVVELEPLPINRMTIVTTKDQIGQIEPFIRVKGLYVFNEREDLGNAAMWPAEEILHVGFNSRGQYVTDIMGRTTYNVWGISPIAVLGELVEWKRQSINTDIKHKRRMLPREHWSANVDSITPASFQGTPEEKIKKATKKTEEMLEVIKNFVNTPQPDQSMVTTDQVQSKILEPTSTNYKDPNETIKQINSFLGTPFGAPEAFLGGEVKGFAGTTMSALFSTMRIDVICAMIAEELEKAIRVHVSIIHPQYAEKIIPRLKIRINSTLDQVMMEKAKVALMMAQLGLFSTREIRGTMGYSGMVQNPYKLDMGGNESRTSGEQMESDAENTTEDDQLNNRSPSGQRNALLGNAEERR